MSAGWSALFWGIITLSFLVLVHEGGHFFAARAFGVRVREFMIGLPGPKLSWKRKGTLYGVTAIPLGGYVKVVGMEGDQHSPLVSPVLSYITAKRSVTLKDLAAHFNSDEGKLYAVLIALKDLEAITENEDGTFHAVFPLEDAEDPDKLIKTARSNSYLTIPTWKRIVILLSGVVCNLAVAILVFTIILTGWGALQDLGHINPVPDAPAIEAGIPEGAQITSINGVAVSSYFELVDQIQSHNIGDEVALTYVVDDIESSAHVTLAKNPESDAPFLGVSPHFVKVKLPVGEAFVASFERLWLTVKGIVGFFNPTNFTESVNNSASVIGIAVIAAEVVKVDPVEYIGLVAMISLSLGLMNLLPIPPLDGGKIVIELVEKIRRKPLSMNTSVAISAIGFLLLFSLMAYLIYVDFGRFILG